MSNTPHNILFSAEQIADDREGRPLLLCPVMAGFPSPAEDYIEETLDLHRYAVTNELATYFLHARGESMIEAGIFDGDLLIVDRSIVPYSGAVVIACLDGEMTVKRYVTKKDRYFLQPENKRYSLIEITGREDVTIWGVVTYVLHKLAGKTLGAR